MSRYAYKEKRRIEKRRRAKRRRKRIKNFFVLVFCLVLVVFLWNHRNSFLSIFQKTTSEYNPSQAVASYQNPLEEDEEKALKPLKKSEMPDWLQEMVDRNKVVYEAAQLYPYWNEDPNQINIENERKIEGIPYFVQWDPRWGKFSYGAMHIADAGCGPTVLSMAYTALTGDYSMNPYKMAKFAEKEGFSMDEGGSLWTLFSEGANRLGLKSQELPLEENTLREALEGPNVVILNMGPGHFTSQGHFIILAGFDGSRYRVLDPNNPVHTEETWDYSLLQGEIRAIWKLSK